MIAARAAWASGSTGGPPSRVISQGLPKRKSSGSVLQQQHGSIAGLRHAVLRMDKQQPGTVDLRRARPLLGSKHGRHTHALACQAARLHAHVNCPGEMHWLAHHGRHNMWRAQDICQLFCCKTSSAPVLSSALLTHLWSVLWSSHSTLMLHQGDPVKGSPGRRCLYASAKPLRKL